MSARGGGLLGEDGEGSVAQAEQGGEFLGLAWRGVLCSTQTPSLGADERAVAAADDVAVLHVLGVWLGSDVGSGSGSG